MLGGMGDFYYFSKIGLNGKKVQSVLLAVPFLYCNGLIPIYLLTCIVFR